MSPPLHAFPGIPIPAATFTDHILFIRQVRAGVPGALVKQAIEVLGGNRELFVRLFDTTSANLSRYYRKKLLSRSDSEELLDTLRVYHQARELFGSDAVAREWLDTPVPALAGERPLELFDTFEGRELVRATLRKLEMGEFT